MPPRKKGGIVSEQTSGTSTPNGAPPTTPSLALSLSYAPPPHGVHPRPFKNPYYTKNVNRRAKNLKALLTQERERDAREREARRLRHDGRQGSSHNENDMDVDDPQSMDVDSTTPKNKGAPVESGSLASQPPPTTASSEAIDGDEEDVPTYASIEAPPSLLPQKHWCDITGLEAPYTDPSTGLRYHDKDVYAVVKSLNMPNAKNYLAARGVTSIVK